MRTENMIKYWQDSLFLGTSQHLQKKIVVKTAKKNYMYNRNEAKLTEDNVVGWNNCDKAEFWYTCSLTHFPLSLIFYLGGIFCEGSKFWFPPYIFENQLDRINMRNSSFESLFYLDQSIEINYTSKINFSC